MHHPDRYVGRGYGRRVYAQSTRIGFTRQEQSRRQDQGNFQQGAQTDSDSVEVAEHRGA